MHLKSLTLFNYKSIEEKSLEFDAKINCFVGKNGIGKTNILDAIYNLAYGKSYFNPLAVQNIRHGQDFFVIEGLIEKEEREHQIVCSLKRGQKKILKKNGKPYERFSEHIGFIPLVIISPSDQDLIVDGSETRRKFIDSVISLLDPVYLQEIISYQKIIQQRNALLKYFFINRTFDAETLEIYNEQLSSLGQIIHNKRIEFIKQFEPIFNTYHEKITNGAEKVIIKYDSQLFENNLEQLLTDNLAKDRALQYTSVGIHKDDLLFEIHDHPIKKFGSQGQQKSLLIALKLAQFDFIKKQSGVAPILLFDDIFDKLDAQRVEKIVEMVNDETFGQLFISDTHADRTEDIVKKTLQTYKIFNL
ncbi:DNA replication/repair protein RecF [Flavobacterium agricola]|uniref:DNA replication and repair protein RecF n=1 Tax=Flavobacterium agricola TaxID=2870839 RepID=A0ABY6M1Y8_9FLAO|nr:DNA replication/repair protein RecF [Flavobacterium agricola]UYW01659.1 DNA replication/repair protein RecF [Flavobacterium agricola]